jgi:hypothetical protein
MVIRPWTAHLEPLSILRAYQKTNKVLRFGQYVYTRYAPPLDAPWPELFYEENIQKVLTLLFTAQYDAMDAINQGRA